MFWFEKVLKMPMYGNQNYLLDIEADDSVEFFCLF